MRETLDYLEREMLDDAGGFHSAQDADSEGIEGKFFVWTRAELNAVLGEEDARICGAVYGVTEGGNFLDPHHPEFGRRNVLSRYRPLGEIARDFGLDEVELEARLAGLAHGAAGGARASASGPASTTGADLVERARPRCVRRGGPSARRCPLPGDRSPQRGVRARVDVAGGLPVGRGGRLLHSWKDGVAKIDGLLDDYACYGLGLIELYPRHG